jgi:cytochrome bd-type quinol oxidase subunit 1
MKKNGWTLLFFIVIGLAAGALANRWLKEVPGLSALTRSTDINWKPAADLGVIAYSLDVTIQFSLVSLAVLVLALWLYRRL